MNETKKECLMQEQKQNMAELDSILFVAEEMIHNCGKSMDYTMAVINKLRLIIDRIKSMELEIMGIKKIEMKEEKEENT